MLSDYALDYLFSAELFNGSVVSQTPDDNPRYSSWGTMMTDLAKEEVKRFSLIGKGHIFTVDLVDGHFEMDGHTLFPPHEVPKTARLRPIYWRQVTRDTVIQYDDSGKELPPKVKYILGWQYTFRGKNHKWELGVE